MKRRITRQSLEELQKALTVLSRQEQAYYIGGGTGTEEDPYTYVEYQDLLKSNDWSGGYVNMLQTSEVEDEETGEVTQKEIIKAIYIEGIAREDPIAKEIDLDAVDIIGVDKSKNKKVSGSWDGSGGDYYFGHFGRGIGSGIWDQSWYDISGNVSGMWDGSGFSGGFMDGDSGVWGADVSEDNFGGGRRPNGGYVSPSRDKTLRFYQNYGITFRVQGGKYKYAESVLSSILNRLQPEEGTFKFLLQRTHTHGLPIELSIDRLVADDPERKRAGGTQYSTSPNGKVYVRLDVEFLERYQKAIDRGDLEAIERIAVGIAETLVHEMLHARLQGVLGAYGISRSKLLDKNSNSYAKLHSEEFKNAYPGIYDYYSRCKTEDELNQADHNIMATHYRPMIVKILRETFPNISEEDCEALSWSGLDNTKAWNALGDNIQKSNTITIGKYKS